MTNRSLITTLAVVVVAFFAVPAFALDTDGDGLSNAFEGAFGTNPTNADTDGDGWSDFKEVFEKGTSPLQKDTDADGTEDASDSLPLDNGDQSGGTLTMAAAPVGVLKAWSGESPQDGLGVYVHNGMFEYSFDVGKTKGVGCDTSIRFTYNSKSNFDGRAGKGFFWLGDTKLTEDSGTGNVTILLEDGTEKTFTYNSGSGTYTVPTGCTCVLTKISSSPLKFERSWPAQSGFNACGGCGGGNGIQKITYVDGKIYSTEDRFGNKNQWHIASTGVPDYMDDSREQRYTFSYYDTDKRIHTVTTPDNAVYTFGFNVFGQLMYVDGPATTMFPIGIRDEYRYTNGSPTTSLNDNMTSITNGTGTPWVTMEYDAADRVSKQCIGGNDPTFDYSQISSQTTTVTDSVGNQRVWTWDSSKLTKTSLTEKTNRNVRSGEGDYTTTWTHDADGYLLTVTYPRGNGIKYVLNSVKLPTTIRRKTDMSAADSSTNDIVEAYTYDASKYYGVLTYLDPRGKLTNYTLNSYGQPTLIEFPTITNVSPTYRVEHSYTYNANGTVASFTDGEGYQTTYAYYTTGARKGRLQTKTVDTGSGHLNLATTYDYEDWGAVKSVTDPRGNTVNCVTERYGNVTEIDAPSALGYVTKLTYDAALRVTERKVKNIDYDGTWLSSPQWWTTTTTYTASGKPDTVTEMTTSAANRVTDYDYDANDNLTKVTRGSFVMQLIYDERNLLYKRIRDPGSSPHLAITEELTYDGNRNRTEYKDPRNNTTTHTYDLFDRRTRTTNALTHYIEWVYDKNDNVTEALRYDATPSPDVLMAHHKTTQDEMNRAWKVEDLLKGTTDTWYARTVVFDKRSLVTSEIDRLGRSTTNEYDGAGRATSSTDPVGNERRWTYDSNGNVTRFRQIEKIPGSSSTETYDTDFSYDALNRQATRSVIDQTNSSSHHDTQWQRDALNFVRRTIDPKGNVVTFSRDGLGRMTQKSEDMGSSAAIVTQWTYDANNNVTQFNDDNNNDTDYAYDSVNRLTTKTYENGKMVGYQYDASGNVTRITDQIGSYLDFGYDEMNQRTACVITKGTGVQGDTDEGWSYDALGRLTQAADNDSIVNFTYDSLSRVLTEEQGSNPLGSTGKTSSYTWNAEGERTKITYPSGFEARETRDDLGRMIEIKDQSNVSVATFAIYGAGGRLQTLGSGNGMVGTWSYDGFRRPTDISHKTSSATERAGFEYGWDANDNPTYEERRHLSGHGEVYTYDKANRLTKVLRDVTDPSAEVASPGTYGYDRRLEYDMDDVFNLTAYKMTPYGGSTTTTSYTTNSMNEYTAIGSSSPTYTDNGALKDDGTYKYKFDAHDRLTEVTDQSNNTLATYKYDALGLGRRTKKVVGSATTRYIYANQQSVEEYDDSGNLLRLYAFGDRIDQVVMMEAADTADVDGDSNTSETMRFFFHTQVIGSVTHVTAAAQTVVERYEYDPYGKITIKDKTGNTVSSSPIGNAYTYTGRQYDDESGLYYYRARQYSPGLGRFVQRDPGEYDDGANPLAYVASRPIGTLDPYGLRRVAGWWENIDEGLDIYGRHYCTYQLMCPSGCWKDGNVVGTKSYTTNNPCPPTEPGPYACICFPDPNDWYVTILIIAIAVVAGSAEPRVGPGPSGQPSTPGGGGGPAPQPVPAPAVSPKGGSPAPPGSGPVNGGPPPSGGSITPSSDHKPPADCMGNHKREVLSTWGGLKWFFDFVDKIFG